METSGQASVFRLYKGMWINCAKPWSLAVDILPLVLLRVAFGALMLVSTLRFVARGWVETNYIAPLFHFTYVGFDWVRPLPAPGMYAVFGLLALLSLCIMLGAWYRFATAAFFVLFTYVELIDKTYYLNHYYFISLLSFLLIFLPLERAASIDAWRSPERRATSVPAWTIRVIRLQLGLVYVFAGLAKLTPDWMLHALPLRIWLRNHTSLPLIGPLFDQVWFAYMMSWGGALYDLSIVFLLLWRRTRPFAFLAVIGFHTVTGLLFPIGMFPWIMIAMTTIFFSGAELRRALAALRRLRLGLARRGAVSESTEWFTASRNMPVSGTAWSRWLRGVLLIGFFTLQMVLPLRHHLYPSDVHWAEEGFRFSWRVMLVEKTGDAVFLVREPSSGREWTVYPNQYLTYQQEKQMSFQPDMLLQFADFIEQRFRQQGYADVEVRIEAYVSLNGRPSRLLFDPNVDVTAQPARFACAYRAANAASCANSFT